MARVYESLDLLKMAYFVNYVLLLLITMIIMSNGNARLSTREKHVKQGRLNAKRQQTFSFAAISVSKNPFFTDLAVAFVCANIPFEKLQNLAFEAFSENIYCQIYCT